ncbi:MAG: DNA repair protein RadC [Bacteroidales bacterium]|jgi:DNA repair protein RadC|nr:DNA repair protein RadC [Bacteroidales bacterium]
MSQKGIKSWAEEDRPREKMLQKGAGVLSNSELLAILLGSGNKEETAVDLARRILRDTDDNLNILSKHTIKSLSQYKGVGSAKAITIIAALELGKRRISSNIAQKAIITCSKDAYELIYMHLHDQPYEHFWALFLDRQNKVLRKEHISSGGLTATIADPNKIIRIALEEYATGLVLFHNHPSGNMKPSPDDIALTKKIKTAAAFFDIAVLDHIIVGKNDYYSFADERKL